MPTAKYNNELREGDIIIFKSGTHFSIVSTAIMVGNAMIKAKGGHFDSVHCAIIIKKKDGKARMAHLIGKGYCTEDMDTMFARDKEKRKFVVFRPKDKEFSKELVQRAESEDAKDIKKYNPVPVMLRALVSGDTREFKQDDNGRWAMLDKQIPTEKKEYSAENCCSQFVAETIKRASQEPGQEKYYPTMPAKMTPKVLESCLSRPHQGDLYSSDDNDLYEIYSCDPNNANNTGLVLDNKQQKNQVHNKNNARIKIKPQNNQQHKISNNNNYSDNNKVRKAPVIQAPSAPNNGHSHGISNNNNAQPNNMAVLSKKKANNRKNTRNMEFRKILSEAGIACMKQNEKHNSSNFFKKRKVSVIYQQYMCEVANNKGADSEKYSPESFLTLFRQHNKGKSLTRDSIFCSLVKIASEQGQLENFFPGMTNKIGKNNTQYLTQSSKETNSKNGKRNGKIGILANRVLRSSLTPNRAARENLLEYIDNVQLSSANNTENYQAASVSMKAAC